MVIVLRAGHINIEPVQSPRKVVLRDGFFHGFFFSPFSSIIRAARRR
jgi:hypothetical protein